jgi:hypothetical protein
VGEGSAGPGVGLLSAVTSAVVVHKVVSEEGIYGMYVPQFLIDNVEVTTIKV